MVWPGFDYSPTHSSTSAGSYSPQTPTSNFFPSGIKNEAELSKFQQQHYNAFAQQFGAISFPFTSPPYASSTSAHTVTKKKPKPVPDEEKTEAYFERRHKNNDSAKRSRENRRKKELEKELRIQMLEAHNMKLQQEIQVLRFQLNQYCQQAPSMTGTSLTPPQAMPQCYQ